MKSTSVDLSAQSSNETIDRHLKSESEYRYASDRSPDVDKTRITFNVGGTIFQILTSSIKNSLEMDKNFKLLDADFMLNHWDFKHQQYFFDRDPASFPIILRYLTTGQLHLPQEKCSQQITKELIYWGLANTVIEPCCWRNYCVGMVAARNLKKFEQQVEPIYLSKCSYDEKDQEVESGREITRGIIMDMLRQGEYSTLSKAYWIVTLIMISISLYDTITMSGHVTHNCGALSICHTSSFVINVCCFLFFLLDIILHLVCWPESRSYILSISFLSDLISSLTDFTIILLFTDVVGEDHKRVSDLFLASIGFVRISLRLYQFVRRQNGIMLIFYSILKSIEELISLLTILVVTISTFAVFVVLAESSKNEQFKGFLDGAWFSMVTFSQVGYGDIVSITLLGRLIAAMCGVWGVVLLGLSIPTMVTNYLTYHFMMKYIREREMIYHYKTYEKGGKLPKIPFAEYI